MYLRQARLNNLSGIERFVYEEQKDGKLNWFPINRSLHLELKNLEDVDSSKQDENELEKKTKQLDGEIVELTTEVGQVWDLLILHMAREAKAEP